MPRCTSERGEAGSADHCHTLPLREGRVEIDDGVRAITEDHDDVPARRPMQIGEVADRTGLSLRTLRHYDEIGLLRPSARSDGGFRLYSAEDLEKLLVIRRMKPLGFSLEAMQEVMDLVGVLDQGRPGAGDVARLRAVVEDARARRAGLVAQLAMADEFLDLLGRRLPDDTHDSGDTGDPRPGQSSSSPPQVSE